MPQNFLLLLVKFVQKSKPDVKICHINQWMINIIYLDRQQKQMFGLKSRKQQGLGQVEQTQKAKNVAQNIQALSKSQEDRPNIKVQFGHEIVFTCTCHPEKRTEYFSWLWKEDSNFKNYQNSQILSNSIQSYSSQKNIQENSEKLENTIKKTSANEKEGKKRIDDKLYSEGNFVAQLDEVGLLKKKLQFQYKGLLSKSTDNDSTLGIPVLFRFRCKNNNSTNSCPFLHILEYCKEEEGKVYYRHKSISSSHTPECTLDDQNIQYNVITRKIDSSMTILEQIIKQNSNIKPKQILQLFAQRTNESDEDFLYEGLHSKNIRRSIKKYFDNAVAKVKGKIKQH